MGRAIAWFWGRRAMGFEVASWCEYARGDMLILLCKGGVSCLKNLVDMVMLLNERKVEEGGG